MNQHVFDMQVYHDDTDSFGVVYHANFIRYFERARIEHMLQYGLRLDECLSKNILFAVRHINIDYVKPLRIYDKLHISSEIVEMRRVSCVYQQEMRLAESGDTCSRADVTVVCLDDQMKPRMMPEQLRQ